MLRYGDKGNGAAAHVTRARAIRGRSRRLPLVAFVLVIFFSISFVRFAFADSWHQVLYRSDLDGSKQYIVAADDRYQAAAIICGRNMDFIANLDAETRQKLSTQGGSFQTLAEGLDDDWPAWNDSTLEDSLAETFGSILWFNMTNNFMVTDTFPFAQFNGDALSLFTVVDWQSNCPNHIYAANLDQTLIAAANEAINIIVGGGSIGGGSSVENVPNGYVIVSGGSKSGNVVTVESQETDVTPGPSRSSFYVDFSQTTSVFEGNTNYIVYVAEGIGANNEPTRTYKVFAYGVPDGVYLLRYVNANFPNSVDTYYIWNSTNTQISYKYTSTNNYKFITDLSTNTFTFGQNSVGTQTLGAGQLRQIVRSTYSYAATNTVSSGDDSGGDGGENPWPTPEPEPPEPTPPDPPEPTPRDPITPTPPDPPTNDPTVIVQTVPSGTDYTEYLKAIIRQLNQITEDMATHCKHIRDAIYSGVDSVIDNMVDCINELNNVLDQSFAGLLDYLEELTKWYESFTKRLHDDLHSALDDMTSLLRQILRKIGIGRGGGQSEIDKQIDDDFDFLEWLINFIASKLSGVIGDFVGDVGALLNGIKDKFPFSIPWDIMALLALLDGTPVTPRFTVTIPAINGWWSATSFVIDLSEYNSVASVARFMINAWWVLVLAMKTDWMLMIMGNHTSLGERFANRVTGGE